MNCGIKDSHGCCGASSCLSPVGSAVSGVAARRPPAAAVGRQLKPFSSRPSGLRPAPLTPRPPRSGGGSSHLRLLLHLLLRSSPTQETDQVTRSHAAPNLNERNQRHSVTVHQTHTCTESARHTHVNITTNSNTQFKY